MKNRKPRRLKRKDSYEEKIVKIHDFGQKVPPVPRDLLEPELTPTGEYIACNNYLRRDNNGQIIETPKEMFWRVAHNVAAADLLYGSEEEMKETREEFYQMLANLEFVPNTPTLSNAAGNLQQLSACFVLPIEDNLDSIGRTLWQTMMIHKTGGGTGFSFSKLRPYGSIVRSTGRTASGAVYFMWMYADATDRVQQGGYRRGANMGVININHPDILRWITIKSAESIINSFNLSVALTDDFMKKVEEDSSFAPEGLKPFEEELNRIILEIQDVLKSPDLNFGDKMMNFEKEITKLRALVEAKEEGEGYELINPDTKQVEARLNARKIFELIARLAWEKGDPGVIFLDRINADNPTPALGPIEATNPCHRGNNLVHTTLGLVSICDLVGKKFSVVTPTGEVAKATAFPAGTQSLFRVYLDNGMTIGLTSNHNLILENGDKIQVGELKAGDRLQLATQPIKPVQSSYHLTEEEGILLGCNAGDGWITFHTNKKVQAWQVGFVFGRQDGQLARWVERQIAKRIDKHAPGLKKRFDRGVWELATTNKAFTRYFLNKLGAVNKRDGVPITVLQGNREFQRGYLRGLFSTDGYVSVKGKKARRQLGLVTAHERLAKEIQILLSTFGIISRLRYSETTLPGRTRKYSRWQLTVNADQFMHFIREIGFIPRLAKEEKVKIILSRKWRKTHSATTGQVVKIEALNTMEPVFNLTVNHPIHQFAVNGIISANCGEQPLLPYESCNLGAINLSRMVKKNPDNSSEVNFEKIKETTWKAVHFLDNVIDMNRYPLPEIEKMTKANRKIGLGVMGWAGMLVQLGISYNSQEAHRLAGELMQFIRTQARQASCELAKKRGVFPNFVGSIYDPKSPYFKGEALRLRHAALTTIAPTGTTSMLADVNSGIEPFFALYYKKNIVNGDQVETLNPYFVQIAKEKGFWSEELMERIKGNKGSVKGLPQVPEEIQRLFPIAADISSEDHILTQAAFQKGGVDNAISKTINMASSATVDDVIRAYRLAYEQGCKGVTIYRDQSRKKQILVTESKEQIREKTTEFTNGETLKPRPVKVEGATYKIQTPLGSAFITVNHDASGNPFEVFITIGRAGSEAAAMAEGLGRMISTTLRFGNHLAPLERAKEIMEQLQGIGGSRSVGFGPNRVRSLPDAVAKAIGMHFGLIEYPSQPMGPGKPNGELINGQNELGEDRTAQITLFNYKKDFCPGCGEASLIYEEGCKKCHTCGYSEC